MGRPPTTAVLGGTFDRLHAGHRALLAAAFANASRVRIGLTTSAYLSAHPKPFGDLIRSYAARRRALAAYLRRMFPGRPFEVVPLDDRFGGSVDPGVDVLVVSEETLDGARAVNRERRRRHLPPIRLVVIPVVRADDLRPISSRRIRSGEVRPTGRRSRAVVISLVGVPPEARPQVLRAFGRLSPGRAVQLQTGGQDSGADWDYRFTIREGPGRPRMELEEPEGRVGSGILRRGPEPWAEFLTNALGDRRSPRARETFFPHAPVSRRWRRTSASRSTAKGPSRRRSRTGSASSASSSPSRSASS
ncbi:MAG: pantetheine-phosphate adenylyltransferase [Candidatus Lutacidiplasmatales archaeon]